MTEKIQSDKHILFVMNMYHIHHLKDSNGELKPRKVPKSNLKMTLGKIVKILQFFSFGKKVTYTTWLKLRKG